MKKKDVMDEDDLIERELEDGVELAVKDDKIKRQRWSRNENEDHIKDHDGEGNHFVTKGQSSRGFETEGAEEGEMLDDSKKRQKKLFIYSKTSNSSFFFPVTIFIYSFLKLWPMTKKKFKNTQTGNYRRRRKAESNQKSNILKSGRRDRLPGDEGVAEKGRRESGAAELESGDEELERRAGGRRSVRKTG